MLGAIIGDIVGSRFESRSKRIKRTDFELFTKDNKFTDDTVFSIAVADWLIRDKENRHEALVKLMQTYGRMYPKAGFSTATKTWINSDCAIPYGSRGNGAAMRVSPVGWAFDNLDDTLRIAELSAVVSHNSQEAIIAAQAVAAAIFMARNKTSKQDIKDYVEQHFGYNFNRTCDEIRPHYQACFTCDGSVPEAIIA